MDTKTKKFIHSKSFIIVLIMILMLLTIITGTYAWFTWSSTENTNLTMSIGSIAEVIFVSGNDITSGLTPVFNYTDGEKTTFAIKNRSTSETTAYYEIKLNITTIPVELRSSDVKYALTKNDTLIIEGDMSNATDGSSITLYTSTLAPGTTNYSFYIYIDANVENDPAMMNKVIVGEITASQVEDSATSLSARITNLYLNNKDDTSVTNNNIEYNYASSVNLMNDRLGGTTADYDAGNIRYYGASPNNYIYFNCEKYPYTNCEIWRIIGIFKNVTVEDGTTQDLIKIIRDESIGEFAWDYGYNKDGASTTRINNWSDSSLNTLLNGSYYNNNDNVTYYSYDYTNQVTTSKVVNFASSSLGIKNNETRNIIVNSYWNLGGGASSSIYSDRAYEIERGTTVYGGIPTSWTGKIALAYPSDYGYAGDFKYCTDVLYNYYNSSVDNPTECRENDWMYAGYRLLTPYSSDAELVWGIYDGGRVNTGYVGDDYSVRPVLYLSTDTNISTIGDGSNLYPYLIITG